MTQGILLAHCVERFFGNNADLCRHTKTNHIKLCHVCHRTFVSDELLVDHIREAKLGTTVCTQEEMICGRACF